MPRYDYRCKECGFEFTKFHGMSEKLTDCIECSAEGTLFKVPLAFVTRTNNISREQKPGEVVKKHIEEAKKEIEKEKRDLINKDYLS